MQIELSTRIFLFTDRCSLISKIRLCHKITCGLNHELDSLGEIIGAEAFEECVCLIGELSIILDVVERLHDVIPVHLTEAGKGVAVALVVVVVEVDRLESVVAEDADGVLCLLADE